MIVLRSAGTYVCTEKHIEILIYDREFEHNGFGIAQFLHLWVNLQRVP